MFRTWMNNFNVFQQQLPLLKEELACLSLLPTGLLTSCRQTKMFPQMPWHFFVKKVTFTHYTKALQNPLQVKSLFIELAPVLKLQYQ